MEVGGQKMAISQMRQCLITRQCLSNGTRQCNGGVIHLSPGTIRHLFLSRRTSSGRLPDNGQRYVTIQIGQIAPTTCWQYRSISSSLSTWAIDGFLLLSLQVFLLNVIHFVNCVLSFYLSIGRLISVSLLQKDKFSDTFKFFNDV